MTTINLEKSLIKQNKKIVLPKELLVMSEYEKFADVENNALARVGMNKVIQEGKGIKDRISNNRNQTVKFSQERVFHISQIKGICEKYRLRFLPATKFKGSIDTELPGRITTFEVAYGIKCDQNNTFIIAPAASFELQERPKDPLFFYQINSEYYYLVHKWGNDLSILRAALPLLTKPLFCLFSLPVLLMTLTLFNNSEKVLEVFSGISIMWVAAFFILSLLNEEWVRFLRDNDWNSYEID